MQRSRLIKLLLVLAVLCGCGLLLHRVDDGWGIGWPPNAVRNWHDSGFLACKGQLVINPGGYQALSHPTIYHGMSPVSIYLPFLPVAITRSTGVGIMTYHLLLALVVFWGTWRLAGRDTFAFWIAAASILCAGFLRFQKVLDPNTIPVLLAVPFTTIVLGILKKAQLRLVDWIGLFVLTLAFTSLNWTGAWAYGLCGAFLLFMPQVSRRALFGFVLIAGVSSALFIVISAMLKTEGKAGESGALLRFIAGYTWGTGGYGQGLTTGRAIVRLGFVNVIGLLPILLAWTYTTWRSWRSGIVIWPALAPVGMAMVEVLFMRNYFAHHPWMSSPVILAALIFSMSLLRARRSEPEAPSAPLRRPGLVGLSLAGCFLYGFAVLMFFRANAASQLSLIGLVRINSERSDAIAMVRNVDPETARMEVLDEILDRRTVVVDGLQDVPLSEGKILLLSHNSVSDPAWKLRAQSSPASSSGSWQQRTASWFNRVIARRRPGDRPEFPDSFFLYEPVR